MKILRQSFPGAGGGHFTFFLICFLYRKKCQILLLPQHRIVHISEKTERTKKSAKFPGSVGHICQEKQDIQIRELATAHAQFFGYLSTTVAQFTYYLMLLTMQ